MVRLSCGDCALPIGTQRTLLLQNAEDEWRPEMMIKFVLLRSPLVTLHDPETVIVRRKHRLMSTVFSII